VESLVQKEYAFMKNGFSYAREVNPVYWLASRECLTTKIFQSLNTIQSTSETRALWLNLRNV